MSQNDIIIRTHYKSPHRLHIDSDIPTPSSEPINKFARQLITLLDTSDLSSMLSYCVTQEFTANCRKISQNCYSTALFTINLATSPIHAENILITLHYKKDIISLLLETTPIKANHLRSILDYIEQEQLTAEDRNHCMKLSKKIHREKTIHPTVNLNGSACFLQSPSDAIFCRHLSLQYALDSLRNGKGKVNLIKHYSSVESIQQHIPLVRDAEFRALLRHPPAGSRVIASKDFGFALDIFFCRMMANNVSHMSAILYIDNHTLSVRLRIKQSVYGQLNYVVSVYDPNDTNVAVRAPTGQHGAFSRLISSSVQLPMLRPGLIGMFATVQLLFFLYYLREFQLLFSGYHDTNAICPYTSIGNVVNNGHRPDSIAYYTIQTVAHTP